MIYEINIKQKGYGTWEISIYAPNTNVHNLKCNTHDSILIDALKNDDTSYYTDLNEAKTTAYNTILNQNDNDN